MPSIRLLDLIPGEQHGERQASEIKLFPPAMAHRQHQELAANKKRAYITQMLHVWYIYLDLGDF
jgi:hypothetical protein